jgi:hypothetical protein
MLPAATRRRSIPNKVTGSISIRLIDLEPNELEKVEQLEVVIPKEKNEQ